MLAGLSSRLRRREIRFADREGDDRASRCLSTLELFEDIHGNE